MKRKISRNSLAVAVCATLSGPSLATETTEPAKVLGEVRVNEERNVDAQVQSRTELGRLTEYTPLAGTVLSHEEIESVHFVDSLHELLPRVPGISMSRNLRFTDGGKNYTENRIDGMRARNTGTYSFVDEVNSGDIERVEFIRGPGSVLSGSNAIGGTINVITRNPPKNREYEASAEGMAYGGYRVSLSGGDALSNSLGYFFNVNRLDIDGWQEHSAELKDSLSTKWVVRPDDASKLSFRLEYLHNDSQSPGTLTQAQFEENWRQAQPNSYFRTNVTFTTPSLHYRRLFGETGELNVFGQSRLTDSTSRASFNGAISDNDATENNLQLIYKHNFAIAKSALTGGLDLLSTDSRTKSYVSVASSGFDFTRGALTGDAKSIEKNRSPFLQYEFSPLSPLRFTLGVRQDRLEYEVDNLTDNSKDGRKEYTKLVKKGGATYELTKDHLLWANIAEGFMGPGVSTLLGSNSPTPATHAAAVNSKYVPTNMNLLPEESITREIGVRGRFDFGLGYDTGYYETDFKDLIVSQECGVAELCYTRNTNAAKAHASGLETALDYDLNKSFALGLTHTYARYAYDDYVSGAGSSKIDYSGKARYYTPRNHFNFRVTYKPAPKWKVELEMDRIDSYYTNGSNSDSYQRPDLYHLRASYNGKQWGFWLSALNLLDTKYAERVGATDAGVRNTYSSGYMPLTVRAGISYKF
jgi:iron complex outermembrane recepter protein